MTDQTSPLHERLLAGALRAGLATLGAVLPLLPAAVERDEAPSLVTTVAVFASALLVLERRDVSLEAALARVAAGGAAAACLLPLALAWVRHLGDPRAGYAALLRWPEPFERAPFVPVFGAAVGLVVGLPVLVRARTARPRPLVALTAVPAVLLLFVETRAFEPRALAAAWVLANVGLALGDRVVAWLGLASASPSERSVWPVAVAVPIAALLGALAIPNLIQRRGGGNETRAIGALKTLATSQSIFREGDKEGNGTLDYAGSLSELSETQMIDSVLGGGQKQGYHFRLVRSPTTPEYLWAAAADPIVPRVTGDRWFYTNHSGMIWYSMTGPIPFADDCQPPPWALRIGR